MGRSERDVQKLYDDARTLALTIKDSIFEFNCIPTMIPLAKGDPAAIVKMIQGLEQLPLTIESSWVEIEKIGVTLAPIVRKSKETIVRDAFSKILLDQFPMFQDLLKCYRILRTQVQLYGATRVLEYYDNALMRVPRADQKQPLSSVIQQAILDHQSSQQMSFEELRWKWQQGQTDQPHESSPPQTQPSAGAARLHASQTAEVSQSYLCTDIICKGCSNCFSSTQPNAKYCSPACRKRTQRKQKKRKRRAKAKAVFRSEGDSSGDGLN